LVDLKAAACISFFISSIFQKIYSPKRASFLLTFSSLFSTVTFKKNLPNYSLVIVRHLKLLQSCNGYFSFHLAG
jgi:hypothetical protein